MTNTVDSMAGKPDPIWTGIVPEKLSVAPEQFAGLGGWLVQMELLARERLLRGLVYHGRVLRKICTLS